MRKESVLCLFYQPTSYSVCLAVESNARQWNITIFLILTHKFAKSLTFILEIGHLLQFRPLGQAVTI